MQQKQPFQRKLPQVRGEPFLCPVPTINALFFLNSGDQIFDLAFHPLVDALAVGLIDGSVEIYKYEAGNSGAESKRMLKCTDHEGSCRGVLFTDDGERLYTISSDRSIHAVDGSGRTVFNIPDAHDDALNRMISVSNGGFLLATGDDAGCVKLWDTRISPSANASNEVMSWTLHEDFVAGFAYREDVQTLLSVGGDARLCTYDLRKATNTNKSDDQEAELQCVQIMKNGRKVACGTQEGVILFFSWDKWGDCSDRFPGHPETVGKENLSLFSMYKHHFSPLLSHSLFIVLLTLFFHSHS